MRLADFAPPETPAASAATALAVAYHSPALLHHVTRSWLWAEGFAALENRVAIDRELLYVSAMLHDIGLAAEFDNVSLPYEEAGGHVAVALTTGAGWSRQRSGRALEVIVRHNWPSVDPAMDVEGYLLEIATALDISGARPDVLPESFIREVLHAYPRLSLAEEFGSGVADQAARKPHSAAHRLIAGGVLDKLARHPLEAQGY